MTPNREKAPREWAQEVAALPSLPERRARLNEVPVHLAPLVKTHLKTIWDRKNNHAAQ
ncbi:hypothetical protein [Marinimicrobium sp. ARAG 43.8]|uniref:hypothetical protein n=1 Tax=Marinimicrobium sp. ARAG 43.8 TaxID=3418719 RepID=UPI003CEA6D14